MTAHQLDIKMTPCIKTSQQDKFENVVRPHSLPTYTQTNIYQNLASQDWNIWHFSKSNEI